MNGKVLDVYLCDKLAGQLRREGEYLVFNYDRDYLKGAQALPLSLSLPLQTTECPPETTRNFFANLLPEGAVRAFVARRHHISPDNDFKLLEALGGDCAGAVALYPQGQRPADQSPSYRPLSHVDLEKLAEEAFIAAPEFLPADHLRLSLAGAQDKLPVALIDDQLCLPENGAPSTHILKPQHARFSHLVENEVFCMRLASEAGLPVPKVEKLDIADGFFLTERYDRQLISDGSYSRIHQEDFCQALGIPHTRKYQSEGGPGLSECFSLLFRTGEPIPARRELIRWVIFNYLIANADAHAKNISLLYSTSTPVLAPFYDLVCTAPYPLSKEMAMAIGGAFDPRQFDRACWADFVAEIGERRDTFVFGSIKNLARELPRLAENLAHEMGEELPISEQICEQVTNRASTLSRVVQHG